jgi:hypothetical protein
MAITVDWPSKVITIPQADLTPLGGGRYELDIDNLRLALKALEDDEDGITWPDTHVHNTEVVLSGVTYARFVEIINGYTVSISPATAYIVSCVGANHNLADVYNNTTGPTLLPNNSAGLQIVETGTSGLTPEESAQLDETHTNVDTTVSSRGTDSDTADAVWDKVLP